VTAVTAEAPPWAAAEVDLDRVLAELQTRFPGARCWHGKYTGSLWGFFRDRAGRDHLVEASNPVELGRRLEAARGRGDSRPAQWPTARSVRPTTVPGAAPPVPAPVPPPVLPVCGRHGARQPWWRRLIGALVAER
jgi:hypothetical protein